MKIIPRYCLLLSLILSLTSLPSHSGKIYRFINHDGISTLSKILPPYVAQQGYDILNDKTLSLIKHVDSREQQQNTTQQNKNLIENQLRVKKEQLIKQRNANILLRQYPTEVILINARNSELRHYQNQINDTQSKITSNENLFLNLQAKAAEQEINNGVLSISLQNRLSTARTNIAFYNEHLKKTYLNQSHVSKQYASDLSQLQKLLK